jgi:hypothetical protein
MTELMCKILQLENCIKFNESPRQCTKLNISVQYQDVPFKLFVYEAMESFANARETDCIEPLTATVLTWGV